MAYKKETIAKVLDLIEANQIMLPSIQRKFVWDEEQIVRLFDSIMCGYPFGTFLFWRIRKSVVNERHYPMYEFIRDFHERDTFKNPPISHPFSLYDDNKDDQVLAILDGQQRLTSLYIAVHGSVAFKLPRKQWRNDDAFPVKELYLNLLSGVKDPNEDEDALAFEFKFLTAAEYTKQASTETQSTVTTQSATASQPAALSSRTKLWYKVKDILKYTDEGHIEDDIKNTPYDLSNKTIIANLKLLFRCLKVDSLINYFEVTNTDSLDEVSNIFVRVNSGGTKLSKTELLFSNVAARWQTARDEFDTCLYSINRFGEGYRFDTDFIMRTCLFVLDMPIALKVETFGSDNIDKMEKNWPTVKSAIEDTIRFIADLGFYADNLTSTNVILPIIYYRYLRDADAFKSPLAKSEFRKYLAVAQLKRIFAGSTTSILGSLRDAFAAIQGEFSLDQLSALTFFDGRNLRITEQDIIAWVDEYEKGPYTFMLLSLLYPSNRFSEKKFEQDHLHPFSSFTKTRLSALTLKDGRKLSSADIDSWIHDANTISNLQLLESHENESKGKKPLAEWLKNNASLAGYIPEKIDYSLTEFPNFIEKRREIIIKKLKSILMV